MYTAALRASAPKTGSKNLPRATVSHIESGFAALVLQWMEDLSDRELERFLTENIAAKFFYAHLRTGSL